MIPLEALRDRVGAAYLGGAAVTLLIATLLTGSTILRFMHEAELREAYGAASRGEGSAASLLGKLCAADPRDADVRVVLGCLESERGEQDAGRLEGADKLFAAALAIDPTRQDALVGQVATRLRMAMAATREGRGKIVDEADELLRGLSSGPDATALEAAVLILRGRAPEALKKLEAPLEGDVTLSALRAWHHNRAVAAVLAKDGQALEYALDAHVLRPYPVPGELTKPSEAPPFEEGPHLDGSRILAAAYRLSLVASPGGPEVMEQRCALARRALGSKHEGVGVLTGRYHPGGRDQGAGWNALGVALLRQEKLDDATEALRSAAQTSREPAYDFNYAEALYRQGLLLPPEDPKRGQSLLGASAAYEAALRQLEKDPAATAQRAFAATNLSIIMWVAGQPQEGAKKFAAVPDADFADLAARYRTLAALYDYGNMRQCIAAYKKAIELGAADGEAMQRRLRYWEDRTGGRR